MSFSYTENEISNILKNYELYLEKYNNCKDIIAKDNNGYKYKVMLSNLRSGKKPNRFANRIFAIYNIKRYLELNCPNYELLDNEYKGIREKMRFICHNHKDKGIQLNTVDNIIHGHHYCRYCSFERIRDERILDLNIVKQLCLDKNVIYYDRYTKNHESVIMYKCKIHDKHIQEMSLTHFRESQVPCKYCGITSGELKILNFLNKNNISYIKEKTFDNLVSDNNKKLRFDFYLHDYDIIIEYDGRQHFEPVVFWNGQNAEENYLKNKYHDKLKNKYCKEHKIKLIRIPYTKYNDIENILLYELEHIISKKIVESSETAGHIW